MPIVDDLSGNTSDNDQHIDTPTDGINISDMAQTWNAGATTFTAIKMNVTDTASAAGSALLDLQLAGTTVLRLQKNGVLQFGGTTSSFPGLRANGASLEVRLADNSAVGNLVAAGAYLGSGGVLALGNDTVLVRDAADALAQRRGVNAQAFRVYNTFTDASNYERGVFAWITNALDIGFESAGTGAPRNVRIKTAGAGANILFSTGGADRWFVNSSGDFLPTASNTFSIGSASAIAAAVFVQNLRVASTTGSLTFGASTDVVVTRDAADTLAQRNSTNPQTFRVYNTFTDGSNFERGSVGWTTNNFDIKTEQLGTGAVTPRSMRIFTVGLASLQFGTNNSIIWNISSSGHWLANTDNTYDIGASGASRPRNVFVGSTLTAGAVVTSMTSGILFTGGGYIVTPSNGVMKITNNSDTGFNRLQFGGTTASFPSISRNAANIDFRLADDSALTGIGAASVSVAASSTARPHFALTAGVAPTSPANGDIWFDGTNLNIRIGGVTRTVNVT